MQEAPPHGYPDFGNGHFTAQRKKQRDGSFKIKSANYLGWWRYNSAVRIYNSHVEQAFISAIFMGISVLRYPEMGLAGGVALVFGRLLLTLGYYFRGPQGRLIGAMITDVSILFLFALSVMSVVFRNKNPASGETTLHFLPY